MVTPGHLRWKIVVPAQGAGDVYDALTSGTHDSLVYDHTRIAPNSHGPVAALVPLPERAHFAGPSAPAGAGLLLSGMVNMSRLIVSAG